MVQTDGKGVLPAPLVELLELDSEAEQKLLDEILDRGWDQGCLLSLPPRVEPSSFSPAHIKDVTARLTTRGAAYPAVPDPFETEPLACGDPGDLQEAYLVLTQRCDLIKGIATEPFVAIGRAFLSSDQAMNSSARAHTSATYLHLSDAANGEAWLLDLRAQWTIPKTWLAEIEPIHLIKPGLPRRRFARGLGNRSARAPVPTEIVDGLQRPLRDWLYQSAARRSLCEPFSDLLVLPAAAGEWALIGIYDVGLNAEVATEKFDHLFEEIRGRVPSFPLSEDDSDAIPIDQISAADFLSAHRLDLDKVSFGSKSTAGNQAEPRL